jgi:PEP-CTERM motif
MPLMRCAFGAALVAGALLAVPAHAMVAPGLSLSFTQATGTVLATDSIDVWVTLSYSDDEAFTFDLSESSPPFGLTPSLLPLTGSNGGLGLYDVEFATYTRAYLYTSRYCSGTFTTTPCDGPPYDVGIGQGPNWFAVGDAYTLAPGASQDFLLLTLTPTGGSAAPGTYEFYNVGLGIGIEGEDIDGNLLEARVEALTCPDFNPSSCSFSRVVTAVPEPGSWAMMLSGLAVALGVARRRRPA